MNLMQLLVAQKNGVIRISALEPYVKYLNLTPSGSADTVDESSEFVQNDYVIQTLSANNYSFGGMN